MHVAARRRTPARREGRVAGDGGSLLAAGDIVVHEALPPKAEALLGFARAISSTELTLLRCCLMWPYYVAGLTPAAPGSCSCWD